MSSLRVRGRRGQGLQSSIIVSHAQNVRKNECVFVYSKRKCVYTSRKCMTGRKIHKTPHSSSGWERGRWRDLEPEESEDVYFNNQFSKRVNFTQRKDPAK